MASANSKRTNFTADFLRKFPAEKMEALERYTKKNGVNLENEMLKMLEKIYEKYVPREVRNFLLPEEEFEKVDEKIKAKRERNSANETKI